MKSYSKLVEDHNNEPLVVYFHGLESSHYGDKVNWLHENFPRVFVPEMKYHEKGDSLFREMYEHLKNANVGMIIGSSIGGYFAYHMCKALNCHGVLFNPAMLTRSVKVNIQTTREMPATYNLVLGQRDDVINPLEAIEWFDKNEDKEDYDVSVIPTMGHRVPYTVFTMYSRKGYEQISKIEEKSSGEILNPVPGKWIKVDPRKHPELAGEFFDLINTAYYSIGGHAKIKEPEDVFADPDWTFWQGIDLHGDQDFDLIIFGQNTKYGVKFSGVGHDGEKDSRREYLEHKAKDLKTLGYYGEVSGKLAEILLNKYHVPVVEDPEVISKLLSGKEFEFNGEYPGDEPMPGKGWYTRKIGGHPHAKIIVGRPKGV